LELWDNGKCEVETEINGYIKPNDRQPMRIGELTNNGRHIGIRKRGKVRNLKMVIFK